MSKLLLKPTFVILGLFIRLEETQKILAFLIDLIHTIIEYLRYMLTCFIFWAFHSCEKYQLTLFLFISSMKQHLETEIFSNLFICDIRRQVAFFKVFEELNAFLKTFLLHTEPLD